MLATASLPRRDAPHRSPGEGRECGREKEALPNEYHHPECSKGELSHVNRTLPTLLLSLAIAAASLSFIAPIGSLAATAATPKPSPSKSPNPKAKKDACTAEKSKYAHAECESYHASAPGDEYFGRMKISYLGIDNTYKDGVISAGDYTTDPKLISKLDFATEALKKWAAKYPNDPQLARSYFLGVQVLRKVYTEDEQHTTWEFIQILVHKYPHTYFGKAETAAIAHGYTEHWFAGDAPDCPKYATAATPTPVASPGLPAVQVLTPPCVQPSPGAEESAAPAGSAKPGKPSPQPKS